jgi:hypothetical protein
MKYVLMIVVFAITLMPQVSHGYSQQLCGQRLDILDTLKKRYSEEPISMGLSGSGGVIEILVSNAGSWTILITRPTGVSCVVSAGEAWEKIKETGENDPNV